ncbi:NADH-quinone oxidoreductase subunit NuoF [Paradesulfitobacterium ferrireducens]|uniref:NADH-quinone oxidoreductase subunit NuoF n=1 Tax=Paradesulfitobacterium ferrireducens TaxID=2816476 RepID=UPI001A8FCBAD|nr:NADH-quinone oxidoreductase subunit NuoF [Paradesulfitobacterium ferrireducens]
MPHYRHHVLVCQGTGCLSSGSTGVLKSLEAEIKAQGLNDQVRVVKSGCFGFCMQGPVMIVYPEGVFYTKVHPADVPEIVGKHLKGGQTVERLLFRDPVTKQPVEEFGDIQFFKGQKRLVLQNCGSINPENIEEYIAKDGYFALAKVLTHMTPEQVIDEVKKSGLRGRGGGGFPTGRKWEFARKALGEPKYVICNADEGDPGAFMDRSILEGDPHAVLEAMCIAGYAVGAKQGYVYVRAEYPVAVKRLEIAIEQARTKGLLGKKLFGTDFYFNIEIRLGAGAFVCGEETSLIRSIQGLRGEPRPRPPFPAAEGLWGKPTLINNVETLANIPHIIRNGSKAFAAIGTERSKGTKVFALAGKIHNTGLIEVPMGTTLREVIFNLGGGIPEGKKFKAAQTGGPSGGCLTEEHLDISLEYDTLLEVGSMMGSGGLIVMDEDSCMVDVARFYLEFTRDESCGKCTPCRIGTKRMLEILTRITEGKGTDKDLTDLEELAQVVKEDSLCGLGVSAPNPVLSTLRYFRHEYEAHIFAKHCPAGVCKELQAYAIDPEMCKACGICRRECPSQAIKGAPKEPHVIETEKCSQCGLCLSKCPFKAIKRGPRTRPTAPAAPDALIAGRAGGSPERIHPDSNQSIVH